MRTNRFFSSLALTAALVLASAPAQAQSRGHERHGSDQRGGGERQGGARQGGQPASQRAQPRPQAGSEAPGVVASRPYTVQREITPNRYGGGFAAGARVAPRVLDRRAFIIGGPRFYRPYYSFRPRMNLGFGLWVGFPVAYPAFDVPYVYGSPYPYADGYAAAPYYDNTYSDPQPYSPSITYGNAPAPESQQPGGLSFTVTPTNAAVFVDGVYVGTAEEFGPTAQPLGLIPGKHHVELRANGYQTMAFDTDVIPGQVLPYEADLQH